MATILLLVAAVAFANAVWLTATVILARIMRVPAKTITYGFGPLLADIAVDARSSLQLRAIPFTTALTFVPRAEAKSGEVPFAELDPWRKIALALAGCIGCFAIALLILGAGEGVRATLATWGEVLRPVTQFNDPAAQWLPIVDAANNLSLIQLSALASAKVAAFNILPLAGLSGWTVVSLLFGWTAESQPPVADTYAKVSLMVLLGLAALWAFSGIEFVARSLGWIT